LGEQQHPILKELGELDPELVPIFDQRDSAWRLANLLPAKYPPAQVAKSPGERAWELAGLFFLNSGRIHESIGIFWVLYLQMLEAQTTSDRAHKGMPLVWISDCFARLGFPVHAKRYLMLTLCEDALRDQGEIPPDKTGAYFRLVWTHGLLHDDLLRYGSRFYELAREGQSWLSSLGLSCRG
jgi:hypothetical protein